MADWHFIRKGGKRPIFPVLVAHPDRYEANLACVLGEPSGDNLKISIARWQRGAWRDPIRGYIIHDVVAWMPLPDVPEPVIGGYGDG